MLIDTSDEVKLFCKSIYSANSKFIAVDTEFSRDINKYYPKLCLIQIAYSGGAVVIDVLADNLDMSPLINLLLDKSLIKIFHDCKQDLQAIFTICNDVVTPVFDTQVAVMIANSNDHNMGYSDLIYTLFGIELDKSAQENNWTKRPLMTIQINYALNDVTYLYKAYSVLKKILHEQDKTLLFQEEMSNIVSDTNYYNTYLWKESAAYKNMFLWRENIAQKYDTSRGNVIPDKFLRKIYKNLFNKDYIKKITSRDISKYFKTADFIKILQSARDIATHNLNEERKACNESLLNAFLTLIALLAKEKNISRQVICSQSDVALLIQDLNKSGNPLLQGWRYNLFGVQLIECLKGKKKLLLSVEIINNVENIKYTLC